MYLWDQWAKSGTRGCCATSTCSRETSCWSDGLEPLYTNQQKEKQPGQREAEPGSPNNWNFISLVFSDTFSSHFNLMDEECNNETSRGAGALTRSHVGSSREGIVSKNRQDTADS